MISFMISVVQEKMEDLRVSRKRRLRHYSSIEPQPSWSRTAW